MKLKISTVNRIFTISLVVLFFSVFVFVMFAFLHPLPGIVPHKVGDCIFIADTLPRDCRIIGIDITSDDHIYLHADSQTLCFDKKGDYLGRFVYNSQGATFFIALEQSNNFWIWFGRSKNKFLCDSQGIVLQTTKMEENEHIFEQEYKQKVTDSKENVYLIQKFLCFSRVLGPNGNVLYDQSVLFKADCIMIIISVVFFVFFGLLKTKRRIRDESLIDWLISGGIWKG